MNILELPLELVYKIASFLDQKSAKAFVQINRQVYNISKDDTFWSSLCRARGIQYCHPESTWKGLFFSGNLVNMCTHLNPRELCSSIPEKKVLLWTSISECLKEKSIVKQGYLMCLHKNCTHFDLVENYEKHHSNTKHSVSIKVSAFSMLEMYCHSCQKTIGFDNFSANIDNGIKAERHIMREVTKGLVFMNMEEQLYTKIVSSRRKIEFDLFNIQMRQYSCHIVEKEWYDTWIDFITEKSEVVPESLTNQKLVQQDGTLNPLLELGKDFEIVGSLARWYIERIYGTHDPLFSIDTLESSANYCKLVHSIKIRRHMKQVARYSYNTMFQLS